ncbi:MAG TPA: AraC family transcriptional regulator [Pyrinomonadaceae bacterium]
MNPKLYPAQSFGAVLKRRQVADSVLTECSYSPETRIAKHSHPLPYFNLILEGAYNETHGSRVRECLPAMLFFHPEGEAHADRFLNDRCRIFRFEIEARLLERAKECSVALNSPVEFTSGNAVWLASRLYRELYASDTVSSLAAEGLLLEILAEASRYNPTTKGCQPPRWLERARELTRANFSESISLDLLAEVVGVHPVHLAREFRRYYRQSIGEYVRQLRVEFACREIAQSATPFLEIAAAAGFADQAHFARTFKRITGLTPGQYRASFRAR